MRGTVLYRASSYYCDQPSSFSQALSACGIQCSYMYIITVRLVGERSEPLSKVFNDQPRDIYIYIYIYSAYSCEMPLCPQILDKFGKICLVINMVTQNSYLTMHFKAPPMATPISTPNLMTKNVVLQSSRYEKRPCYLMCYFAQVKIHPSSSH